MFMTAEAAPDMMSISMGAFGDADFPPPRAAFWASRKPFWCEFAAETRLIDQQ